MSAAHRDEIAKLESLYQENPEGRVFTHLAEAYRKAGEFDRAQEILSDGVRRHPDYSSAHVVRGRVLMDQERNGEAEEAFRRVLELDPHNLIAVRSLAELARSRGDDAAAVEFYGRVLEQEPGDDEVREIVEELTGVRHPTVEQEGRPEGAGRALPLDDPGDDAEVRTETIAQVYARQGLYDRAAEVYRELVRARPDDHALRDRLAEMEQLAEAQTGRGPEVDAVSDFDIPGPGPLDYDESEEPDDVEDFGLEGFENIQTDRTTDTYAVEGLEPGELDATDAETVPLAGLEVDEKDPETGLRQDATPDTARPEEDLSETMDVRDVPEPPEEMPWAEDVSAGPVAEPDWLAEVRSESDDELADPEPADSEPADSEPADEAIWTGADWSREEGPEATPHAWTEPADDEQAADTTPPVRAYFGDLLSWSGGAPAEPGPEEGAAREPAAAQEPPAAEESAAAGEPAAAQEPASPDAPEPGAAEPRSDDDDDDLDMFRSWLESLKQ